MTASPSPPEKPKSPDPFRERAAARARARVLRYRSREHAYRSEVALDGGDLAAFEDNRHAARLERELADEEEK